VSHATDQDPADAHTDFVFALEPGTIAALLALIVRPSWRS